ncbi:spindle and kinetochore-associated protein 2 [Exaiptasia diaphana]|uniref:Protein FAM33A n=1 Tax=Exaiptasia diaphana TaxID=2652724 RepID=A0A913X2J9_EXADI|nr:spindle and kinetochore-associated protein 2 [Exaiptasia diaphana]
MESVVDKLEALVQKAESDLNYVSLRLDSQFTQQFSKQNAEQLNPVKIFERIKKAREEFHNLTSQAETVCAEQQKVQASLVDCLLLTQDNLQNLQQKTGSKVSEKTAIEEFLHLHRYPGVHSPEGSSCSQEDMEEDKENSQSQFNDASIIDADQTEDKTESRKRLKEFIPVTKCEFDSVSALVKGRVQLEAVNKVHEVIFNHFKANKKSSPLTISDMAEMGLKITGATGQAKLKVLRSLKIIQITNKGAVKWQT